jgi:2-oxoglutarate ferredoxin oxidoreductase subunit beta
MHDGSCLVLYKLDASHDPRDADAASMTLRRSAAKGEVATGLLYVNESQEDLHSALGTVDRPLNAIPMSELCPGSKRLDEINARLR